MGLKITVPKHIWNAYGPLQSKSIGIGTSRATTRSKNCKIKLTRFHYGGPKRRIRGQWSNEITYEQPCLQLTCISCREWYPHLLGDQALPGASGHDSDSTKGRSAKSTIGDEHSETSTTHQPPAITFGVTVNMTTNVPVPPSLAKTNPRKHKRVELRPTPRRRCHVQLRFLSRQGKKAFKALVRKHQREEKKRRRGC